MYPSTINAGKREHRGRRWLRNRPKGGCQGSEKGEKKPVLQDRQNLSGWVNDLIEEMETEYMMIGQELCYR